MYTELHQTRAPGAALRRRICHAGPDLSRPRAISTQTVRTNLVKRIYDICERFDVCEQTYLTARIVSQVTPIHVENRVIIHVQKLMYEGVLHILLVEEVSLEKDNCARIGREPARTGEVKRLARDVG
jgi:hypothetical protein